MSNNKGIQLSAESQTMDQLALRICSSQRNCMLFNLIRVKRAQMNGEVVLLKIEDKPALRLFYDSKLKVIHQAYGELYNKITINEVSGKAADKELKRLDKKLSDYRRSMKA